jgi:hypothetical protein
LSLIFGGAHFCLERELHVISSRLECEPVGREPDALDSRERCGGWSGGAGSGGVVGGGYTSNPATTHPQLHQTHTQKYPNNKFLKMKTSQTKTLSDYISKNLKIKSLLNAIT